MINYFNSLTFTVFALFTYLMILIDFSVSIVLYEEKNNMASEFWPIKISRKKSHDFLTTKANRFQSKIVKLIFEI